MKLTTHTAVTTCRRGSCPLNPRALVLLAALFALAGMAPAWANPLVAPVSNPNGNGNPKCVELGFDFGFKPQVGGDDADWQNGLGGTFPIPGGEITFLRAAAFPTSNSHVGFQSTVPVAGFIVKGGPNANFYDYDGNGLSNVLFDTNLTVPDHPSAGQKPAVSHVEVCLNYRLTVEKTAAGTFDRTYEWEIDKSVTPEAADIFFGDSQAYDYSVEVTNSGASDANFQVTGTITVSNPFPGISATNLVVTDLLDDGTVAVVDCLSATTVAGGASVQCSYTAAPADASATLNTASASYMMGGDPRASTGSAAIAWTPVGINSSVTIDDRFDGGDAVVIGGCSVNQAPCSFDYSRTLVCSDIDASENGDSGSKLNTASIVQTGDGDSASVQLTCYRPTVAKTARASFTREFFWTVVKALEGDDPPLLSEGQSYTLNYGIDVDLAKPPFEDRDYAVAGSITVSNPAPIAAVITSVTDHFPGGTDITVNCGTDAPFNIAAGGSLTCQYAGDSDGSVGLNTATAVQRTFERDADGSAAPLGTVSYTGTAPLVFVAEPVNACVDVIDLLSVDGTEIDVELLIQAGFDPDNASVCAGEVPVSFSYSITETWFELGDAMAEPPICELLVDNTAVVVEFDRDAMDPEILASSTVLTTLLNANCTPEGCTLTRGYWQTHSAYGPAPYDANWANVEPAAEDSIFFLSGQSWYEVFWTPPAGGNVYYRLAPQYMAAALNVLNGASIPADVEAAWNEATALFERCGPNDFARTRVNRQWTGGACMGDAGRAGEIADLLDRYNNGLEGVPHCSSLNQD